MGTRRAAAALLTLIALVPLPAPASRASLRERVLAEGRSRGVDATSLLERRVRLGDEQLTVGALLDRFESTHDGLGPAGSGEVQAGVVSHFAFSMGGPEVTVPYRLTRSAYVPESEPVSVTVPATPATTAQLIADFGGPLTQVRGGDWMLGAHVIGGPFGNVSTTGSAGLPATTSGRDGGMAVLDRSIDFTGHVGAVLNDRSCVLGVFCVAIGTLLADGVAWYEPQLVPGVPRPATPAVP